MVTTFHAPLKQIDSKVLLLLKGVVQVKESLNKMQITSVVSP